MDEQELTYQRGKKKKVSDRRGRDSKDPSWNTEPQKGSEVGGRGYLEVEKKRRSILGGVRPTPGPFPTL